MFVYELSGCGFESSCSHLNFRFRACFVQGVPWHSGNYRVRIHSETRTWHDKNIQTSNSHHHWNVNLSKILSLFYAAPVLPLIPSVGLPPNTKKFFLIISMRWWTINTKIRNYDQQQKLNLEPPPSNAIPQPW